MGSVAAKEAPSQVAYEERKVERRDQMLQGADDEFAGEHGSSALTRGLHGRALECTQEGAPSSAPAEENEEGRNGKHSAFAEEDMSPKNKDKDSVNCSREKNKVRSSFLSGNTAIGAMTRRQETASNWGRGENCTRIRGRRMGVRQRSGGS